ncbi:hypothetical protein OOJ96_23330 [Pseudomonas sp. 15FMM2]|uniref:Uncharacterized protein n=1 Tax=Pseudomonas imrae TaxID=2992837 RepID=A0ACC7PIU3_9PSED
MDIKHLSAGNAAATGIAPQAPIKGVFALPGISEKVTAQLILQDTGPLERELLIAFTDKATGQPIKQFDEELTQQLHVLATDDGLTRFIHEHARKAEPDGRFKVKMSFPANGTYYVYADAVPTGLGQQVVRFEVAVGVATGPTEPQHAPVALASGSDGPYTVTLEPSALQAATESMMPMTVLKNGKPATDLGLYLGVAAHAVFIGTEDLAYVHAHAMAAHAGPGAHASQESHDAPALPPASLMLHVTPPHAGRYALWIQFKGGDQIRTVPFTVEVQPASPKCCR